MAYVTSRTDINADSQSIGDWTPHLIPAEDKTEEWALQFFKRYVPYLQPLYSSSYYNVTVDGRGGVDMIRDYAMGTVDGRQYKTYFDPQDKEGKFLGINWTNIPAIIPRFRQKLIADIQKIPVEINAMAVDPIANSKRQKDKERLKIQKILDQRLAELSKIIGYPQPVKSGIASKVLKMPQVGTSNEQGQQPINNAEFDLSDDAELQIYMDKESGFYNQDVELAQELSIEAIFKLNKIEDLKQRLIEYAVDYGHGALRAYCSSFTGLPSFDFIEANQLLVPPSSGKDISNAECWAMCPLVSLNDLIRTLGHCLTTDDVKEIYSHSVKTFGWTDANGFAYDSTWSNGRRFTWNDFDRIRVPLYYMEFRSPHCDVYEHSTTRYGDKKVKKKDFYYEPKEEGKERKERWYDCIYKGYFINGIDRVYDYGKLNNMVREKGYEQMTPYSLLYWKFEDRSAVEKMIPHCDNIIILWLKFQYMVLKAKPPGYSFNVDAMSDIVLGDGGTITAIDMAKMYEQTGSTFHRTIDEGGNAMMANANSPHMFLQNGLDPSMMMLWQGIRNEMQMISEAIGLNEFTNASTPSVDSLVGIQKMAVLNSQDARFYLQYGTKRILEQTAQRTSLLIQQIIKYNPKATDQIKGMIGDANVAVLESMEEIPLHQFAIFLSDSMSEQEKLEVKQFLLQAYSQGKVDLQDCLNLYFIRNWKLMAKLLALKYSKRQAQSAQIAQQGMQMELKSEADMAQLKLMLEQIKGDNMKGTAEVTGKYNLLDTQMKEQGDLVRKTLQEINKMNIAKEKMGHEKEMADSELA